MNSELDQKSLRVGLFATCLVDLMRPGVGFAAARLLSDAGCRVEVPEAQTCCGQPAYNSGDMADTRAIAEHVIATFEDFDYVVVPSGSCAGTLTKHYPELFEAESDWHRRAVDVSNKTFELTQFLMDVLKITELSVNWSALATYHDSCSGLRELGIKAQPRDLLDKINGLRLAEGQEAETCCGFGGLFCIKYGDISEEIVSAKVADIQATNTDMVLGGDLGCLMNIAGRLKRLGDDTEVRHIAEVLADMRDLPPIAEPAVETVTESDG
jgi:L-lactate dehydrogenase complex protein LldE